jgi:large subunit ribosomal protein L4
MDLSMIAGGTVTVSDQVFGIDFKEALIHEVVVAQQAAARSGSSKQKTRSDVRGGGIKPRPQKGGGTSRMGTIRSPLCRGGGCTFASRPRSYKKKVNRKAYRVALRSVLSQLIREERILVVDKLEVASPKTKDLIKMLDQWGVKEVLLVVDQFEHDLYLASRNLYQVAVLMADEVDPVTAIAFDKMVITKDALQKLEERLS